MGIQNSFEKKVCCLFRVTAWSTASPWLSWCHNCWLLGWAQGVVMHPTLPDPADNDGTPINSTFIPPGHEFWKQASFSGQQAPCCSMMPSCSSHCHNLLIPLSPSAMPTWVITGPQKVYSLNIKVENVTYNPSLSRNIHVYLHLLYTAAGEVQELIPGSY